MKQLEIRDMSFVFAETGKNGTWSNFPVEYEKERKNR